MGSQLDLLTHLHQNTWIPLYITVTLAYTLRLTEVNNKSNCFVWLICLFERGHKMIMKKQTSKETNTKTLWNLSQQFLTEISWLFFCVKKKKKRIHTVCVTHHPSIKSLLISTQPWLISTLLMPSKSHSSDQLTHVLTLKCTRPLPFSTAQNSTDQQGPCSLSERLNPNMPFATSLTCCLMEPSAFVFCFHLKRFLFWLIVDKQYSTTGIYCEQYGCNISKDRQYTWRQQLN